MPLLDIHQMTEEDVKTHFITPAIQRKGWTDYMSMETQITDNTWDVTGFSDEEVFAKMDGSTNSIFDACEPSVVPIMEIEEIDGKKIIVATIRPGMARPYYLRKDGMMEGTYSRIAGVTRKAEPYMIKELQLEGMGTSFEVAIGAAFQYMHIIEKWGTGIPRILQRGRRADYGGSVFHCAIRLWRKGRLLPDGSFQRKRPGQLHRNCQHGKGYL